MELLDEAFPKKPELSRTWTVFNDYRIESNYKADINPASHPRPDVLLSDGSWKSTYAPSAHKELPGEVAKLRNGNEEIILKFARTYGNLGYLQLRKSSLPHYNIGEPIPWISAHAALIHFCLTLIKGLKDNIHNEIRDITRDFYERMKSDSKMRLWLPGLVLADHIHQGSGLHISSYCGIRPEIWERFLKEDFSTHSTTLFSDILNNIINWGISNIRIKLDASRSFFINKGKIGIKPSGFALTLDYSALIEVVYWHLATTISKGRIQGCKSCGSLFIQTDPRQEYCPSSGFHGKESPCAIHKRVNDFRLKQKAINLHKVGVSHRNISRQLNVEVKLIKEWVDSGSNKKGGSSHGKAKRKG